MIVIHHSKDWWIRLKRVRGVYITGNVPQRKLGCIHILSPTTGVRSHPSPIMSDAFTTLDTLLFIGTVLESSLFGTSHIFLKERVTSLLTLHSRTILCRLRCAYAHSSETQEWGIEFRCLSTFCSFHSMHHILFYRYSADAVHCEYIGLFSYCFLSILTTWALFSFSFVSKVHKMLRPVWRPITWTSPTLRCTVLSPSLLRVPWYVFCYSFKAFLCLTYE